MMQCRCTYVRLDLVLSSSLPCFSQGEVGTCRCSAATNEGDPSQGGRGKWSELHTQHTHIHTCGTTHLHVHADAGDILG